MSATMTDLRADMRKDPDELEHEADQARNALENTLYELEQRLSPSVLVDRVATAVKDNAGEFGANLLAQVRNNPVPTVLSSVGLAWLMAASKRPPARAGDGASAGERWAAGMRAARESAQRSGDAVRNATGAASDAYRGAADAAANAYQMAADTTADAASRVVDTSRAAADRVARASRGGVQTLAECYSYLRTEQPLLLGAIAILAGAALGVLIPRTSAESAWLGDASDAAKERIKGEARRQMHTVKEEVARAAEAVRQSPGDTGAGARDEPG